VKVPEAGADGAAGDEAASLDEAAELPPADELMALDEPPAADDDDALAPPAEVACAEDAAVGVVLPALLSELLEQAASRVTAVAAATPISRRVFLMISSSSFRGEKVVRGMRRSARSPTISADAPGAGPADTGPIMDGTLRSRQCLVSEDSET
jgi:hypothetical protein